jgi:hypothetical protein
MEMHPDGSGPLLNLGAALDNLYKECGEWLEQHREHDLAYTDSDKSDVAGALVTILVAANQARLTPRELVTMGVTELAEIKKKVGSHG